jgi:hypothetical protein
MQRIDAGFRHQITKPACVRPALLRQQAGSQAGHQISKSPNHQINQHISTSAHLHISTSSFSHASNEKNYNFTRPLVKASSMKNALLILCLCLSIKLAAQIKVTGGLVVPKTDFAKVMKKAPVFGLHIVTRDESWVQLRWGFTYSWFHPLQDTLFGQGYYFSNDTSYTYTTYEVYHKYTNTFMDVGFDVTKLQYKGLCLYPGMDVLIGFVGIEYDTKSKFSKSGESTYWGAFGYRFRLGLSYIINDRFTLMTEAEMTRTYVNNDYWNKTMQYTAGLWISLE